MPAAAPATPGRSEKPRPPSSADHGSEAAVPTAAMKAVPATPKAKCRAATARAPRRGVPERRGVRPSGMVCRWCRGSSFTARSAQPRLHAVDGPRPRRRSRASAGRTSPAPATSSVTPSVAAAASSPGGNGPRRPAAPARLERAPRQGRPPPRPFTTKADATNQAEGLTSCSRISWLSPGCMPRMACSSAARWARCRSCSAAARSSRSRCEARGSCRPVDQAVDRVHAALSMITAKVRTLADATLPSSEVTVSSARATVVPTAR